MAVPLRSSMAASWILYLLFWDGAAAIRQTTTEGEPDIAGFEKLDEFAHCENTKGKPSRLVYESNLKRAKGTGFPTVFEEGKKAGLTSHEVAALMGWTTGDYKFISPVARGRDQATFKAYPVFPVQSTCTLSREEVWPYIDVLTHALQKLPPAPGGMLWRGQGQVSDELGAIVTLPGFASTSYNLDAALDFVTRGVSADKPAGRSVLAIESHSSGKFISKFSVRRAENEVLFLNSRFQVVACSPTSVSEANREAVRITEAEAKKKDPRAEVKIVCLKEIAEEKVPQPAEA